MIQADNLDPSEQTSARRFLFVCIGDDSFGVPIDSVKEVIEYSDTTMIPMCSKVIKGVINVRGSVIPVLDIQYRLGLNSHQTYDKYSCIVLYDFYDDTVDEIMTLGLLVKNVLSIESIQPHQLEVTPSFGANIPKQFVWKMAKLEKHLTILLDMSKVLNTQQINALLKTEQDHYFHQYCQR